MILFDNRYSNSREIHKNERIARLILDEFMNAFISIIELCLLIEFNSSDKNLVYSIGFPSNQSCVCPGIQILSTCRAPGMATSCSIYSGIYSLFQKKHCSLLHGSNSSWRAIFAAFFRRNQFTKKLFEIRMMKNRKFACKPSITSRNYSRISPSLGESLEMIWHRKHWIPLNLISSWCAFSEPLREGDPVGNFRPIEKKGIVTFLDITNDGLFTGIGPNQAANALWERIKKQAQS